MPDELDPKELEDFEGLLDSLQDDISVLKLVAKLEDETEEFKDSMFIFTMEQLQRKSGIILALANKYGESKGIYSKRLSDPDKVELPVTEEEFFTPKS